VQAKSHRDQEAPDSPSATRQAAWRDQPNAPIRDLSLAGIHDILSLQSTIGNRIVSGILADRPAVSQRPPSPLRDLLSNSAASKPALHVQRDEDAGSSADPKKHSSYGSWLQSMPADAIDYTAVDITGKIAAELPDLADLVTDLKADCADVTILLKHYYLQAHGQTQTMKSIDPKDSKKTVDYRIGAGISRKDLRLALVYLGTVSFQEKGRSRLAFVRYYGGSKPIKNLKAIIQAGLTAGDVLVWRKLPGIKGNFSGHVQTVQYINPYAVLPPGYAGPQQKGSIQVLQGTMESGEAKGQAQSRVLDFALLTGRDDGDAPISFQPESEEEFYGAGKW
jgi:hypothetical protein